MSVSSVKVAVRVRPLVSSEVSKGCKEILETIQENEQIVVKPYNKSFTYNYVFDTLSNQDHLYKKCVEPLLSNLFQGFNVTILAYGQTGSGKTHSMGTAYQGEEDMGVIPRSAQHIFSHIRDNFTTDFTVTVSFIELYQEILYDLLADKSRDQCALDIREDLKGVYIPNLTEKPVESAREILDILVKGSYGRATGCTAMNSQSSRSHAIFTINIAMQNKIDKNDSKTAKLHLVDLAGSERPKKTGAVGTTFKEGVNINKGLFVLGNVISCLGDEKAQNSFVPYRDSNLTRLLKDSLGGNSLTLMIACVSPADYNIEETLSTLRYADRARKIKNKPVVNQDPTTAEINQLKREIKRLQLQIIGQGGSLVTQSEIDKINAENETLNVKIRQLRCQLAGTVTDKTNMHEKIMILQTVCESTGKQLQEVQQRYNSVVTGICVALEDDNIDGIKDNVKLLKDIQEQLSAIHSEHIKAETEIRKQEDTFDALLQTTGKSVTEAPMEINEEQECHTTKQMYFHSELQEILKQLALKEQLAMQIEGNAKYMVDEAAIVEMEKKIAILEKEKEELVQQLKNVKTVEVSGKVAEQKQKKLQDLEEQIKDLTKKVQGQARMKKLKEKDEQRIKQLHQEILQMKQAKVKLIKNMKEESKKFQQWKLQKERELARVKQQDTKKQNEMVKMKIIHAKQQNVLKKKFEEAAALNKRLQHSLALREQIKKSKMVNNTNVDKIGPWLKQEYEILTNLVEAEGTLEGLLEDRATLQQQLDDLKNISASLDEIKSIEEDIELRSVQIQDLQVKLLESEEENKQKTRFDGIQTMAEAKHALALQFEQAARVLKDNVQLKIKCNDLHDIINEQNRKFEEAASSFKSKEEMLSAQQQTYEEKVAVLLRQLRGIKPECENPNSELSERCKIQEEQIEKQEKLISALTKRLEEIEKKALETLTPQKLPVAQEKPKNMPKKEQLDSTYTKGDYVEYKSDLDESVDNDDVENDPDWKKTPLFKRIAAHKRDMTKLNYILHGGNRAPKRSSEGGCTCKTKCNSVRCGCKKTNRSCEDSCKCNETVCENREKTFCDSEESNSETAGSASSGNLPEIPTANEREKKRVRRKPLFLLD